MNRGYATYLKESKSAVKQTFSKKRNYFKYYAWLILTTLGRLLILPASIMDLATVKLSKNVLNNRSLSIYDSFNGACRGKNFWSLVISKLLVSLLFVAGVFVICVFGVLIASFSQLGIVFFDEITYDEYMLLEKIFLAPTLITLFVFSILIIFKTAPISYVAFTEENVSPHKILTKSHKAMAQGKMIVFLNALRVVWFLILNFFIIGLLFFVFEWVIVTFIISQATFVMFPFFGEMAHLFNSFLTEQVIGTSLPYLVFEQEVLLTLFKIIYAIEFIALFIAIIHTLKLTARLTLTCSVANYALFEDLVDDKYNENKVAVGVYVSKSKSKKVKDLTLKDVFASEDTGFDSNEKVFEPLKDLNNYTFADETIEDSEQPSSEVK